MTHTIFFSLLVLLLIAQRLLELRSAKRNTRWLLSKGGREFGQKHYSMIVGMHSAFFASFLAEFFFRRAPLVPFWPGPLAVFALAQALRFATRRTMGTRWTTRVIAVPGEQLISTGTFRIVPHPNYLAVALELFSLPSIFGLWDTMIVFTVLNAIILLTVRIPCERAALEWSQRLE